MRRIFVFLAAILICNCAFGQKKKKATEQSAQTQQVQPKKELPAPFKGGIDSMFRFFKENLKVSPEIMKAKASGAAIIKFSAEKKGMLTSIVVYYADDYLLTQPAIDALRRTNGKWDMPAEVDSYDFVIQFVYNYKPTGVIKSATSKAILDYYQHHKPIVAPNQVPLKHATLLPTIVVDYQ